MRSPSAIRIGNFPPPAINPIAVGGGGGSGRIARVAETRAIGSELPTILGTTCGFFRAAWARVYVISESLCGFHEGTHVLCVLGYLCASKSEFVCIRVSHSELPIMMPCQIVVRQSWTSWILTGIRSRSTGGRGWESDFHVLVHTSACIEIKQETRTSRHARVVQDSSLSVLEKKERGSGSFLFTAADFCGRGINAACAFVRASMLKETVSSVCLHLFG